MGVASRSSWATDRLTEVGKELDCFVAIAQRNEGYGSTQHRRASAITALERPQGVLADKMFRSRCVEPRSLARTDHSLHPAAAFPVHALGSPWFRSRHRSAVVETTRSDASAPSH